MLIHKEIKFHRCFTHLWESLDCFHYIQFCDSFYVIVLLPLKRMLSKNYEDFARKNSVFWAESDEVF